MSPDADRAAVSRARALDAVCTANLRMVVRRRSGRLRRSARVGAAALIWHYSKDLPDSAQLQRLRAAGDDARPCRRRQPDRRISPRERRLYLPIQAVPKLIIDALPLGRGQELLQACRRRSRRPAFAPRSRTSATAARAAGRRAPRPSPSRWRRTSWSARRARYERKIREALVALRIEATYSKDKILELYLNEIYLGAPAPGQGSYGIAAAALNYFGKSVHELTCRKPPIWRPCRRRRPTCHPFRNRERAIERRNYVLDRMAENGFVLARGGREGQGFAARRVNPRSVSPNNIAGRAISPRRCGASCRTATARRSCYEGGLSVRSTRRSEDAATSPARRWSTVSCASTRRAAGAAPSEARYHRPRLGPAARRVAGARRRLALAPRRRARRRRRSRPASACSRCATIPARC